MVQAYPNITKLFITFQVLDNKHFLVLYPALIEIFCHIRGRQNHRSVNIATCIVVSNKKVKNRIIFITLQIRPLQRTQLCLYKSKLAQPFYIWQFIDYNG